MELYLAQASCWQSVGCCWYDMSFREELFLIYFWPHCHICNTNQIGLWLMSRLGQYNFSLPSRCQNASECLLIDLRMPSTAKGFFHWLQTSPKCRDAQNIEICLNSIITNKYICLIPRVIEWITFIIVNLKRKKKAQALNHKWSTEWLRIMKTCASVFFSFKAIFKLIELWLLAPKGSPTDTLISYPAAELTTAAALLWSVIPLNCVQKAIFVLRGRATKNSLPSLLPASHPFYFLSVPWVWPPQFNSYPWNHHGSWKSGGHSAAAPLLELDYIYFKGADLQRCKQSRRLNLKFCQHYHENL